MREQFPILADSTYLVSHSMGAAPLGARAALEAYWDQWASRRSGGLGALAAPHRRNRRRHRRDRRRCARLGLSRAKRFDSASRNRKLHRLQRGSQRSRLRIAAVPVAHLRLARMGAVSERLIASSTPTTAARFQPSESSKRSRRRPRSPCSPMPTTSPARSPTFARFKRTAAQVGALLCVDAYQTTGIYPYDVTQWDFDLVTGGSHKWLCGGPGCGLDLRQAGVGARASPGASPAGWRTTRPFAFEPAPIVYADSMYRFGHGTPTIPGYVVASAGPRNDSRDRRAADSRAQRSADREDRCDGAGARTASSRRRSSRAAHRLDRDRFRRLRTACRQLIARRVFVDYRPGCGIRVSPHFYTADDEIDAFFRRWIAPADR